MNAIDKWEKCIAGAPHDFGETANYLDSRTPEERANETKSILTTTSALPKSNEEWVDEIGGILFGTKFAGYAYVELEKKLKRLVLTALTAKDTEHAEELGRIRREVEGMKKERHEGDCSTRNWKCWDEHCTIEADNAVLDTVLTLLGKKG